MDNNNREAALKRIRALLAKTVANGCSESEAMAAAAKAGELMDRYGLTYSDLELKSERCQQHEATDRHHYVELVANAIARFCHCRVWSDEGRIQYFGLPIDVLIAGYMTDLCRSAMESGFKTFLHSDQRPQGQSGRALRKPFMVAMGLRLSERIKAMAMVRERTAITADGTSLVLVKNAVVDEQYHALGYRFTRGPPPRQQGHAAAQAAGQAAGDRVNLVPGVQGAPASKLLP